MPPSNSHLELNVNMDTALPGAPMIALMLLPPTTSRVVINLGLSPEGLGATAATSGAPTETILPRDGDHKQPPKGPKDKPLITTAPPLPVGSGFKRARDTTGDRPEVKSLKTPRMEAGPSTMRATGTPQYVPDSEEVLLVLPPMPKSLYDELTTLTDGDLDSSVTEPETSEDEMAARRRNPFAK